MEKISKKKLERYPLYLAILKDAKKNGCQTLSAAYMAKQLNVSEELVRKDLQLISNTPGTPKAGRNIHDTIIEIEKFLGMSNQINAILVGVGNIGKALLADSVYRNTGVHIMCAFDNNADLINRKFRNYEIFDIEKMPNFLANANIQLVILTTTAESAQGVCDILNQYDIKGIWNFSHAVINVREGISVEDVNFNSSLAKLCHNIRNN